jgi:hypothetical protein
MMFRTVKDSVVSILGTAAAGSFRVLGYQDQNLSADQLAGTDRLVQVFYKSGEFPRSASGRGPFAHNVTLQLMLTVSAPASADLTVLDSPAATPGQIAAALAALEPSGKEADDDMDALFDAVYTTLMSGPNLDLGHQYEVTNRWIESFEKTEPLPRGEYAVVGGTAELKFRVSEEVPTATKADLDFVSNDLSIKDDGDPKAGTETVY